MFEVFLHATSAPKIQTLLHIHVYTEVGSFAAKKGDLVKLPSILAVLVIVNQFISNLVCMWCQ